MKKLKENFEKAVRGYIKAFCKKHSMELEFWVADDVGTICMMNDFYFHFDDIRKDIDLNADKDLIVNWYYDTLQADRDKLINYDSYIMGLRYDEEMLKRNCDYYGLLEDEPSAEKETQF